MSSAKSVLAYGIEALTEASYGAGGTFAPATDGFPLAEPTPLSIGYAYDGRRHPANASAGQLTRNPPVGRSGEITVRAEPRGLNSAYNGTTGIWELHQMMRMSGHSATFSATPTPQWTYAPRSSAYESGAIRLFARGQQYDMTGVYADFGFVIDGPSTPIFEFASVGKVGIPVDAALAAITYLGHKAPVAKALTVSIGGVATQKVRRIEFRKNAAPFPRLDINASDGHAGFGLGRRDPVLTVTIEANALATWDPYTVRENATDTNVNFTVGSTQYNRWKFTAAQAQLVNVTEDADEAAALWTLEFSLGCTVETANDDYSFLVN